LLIGPAAAARLAKALRKSKRCTTYAAKDVLRAAGLPLLAPDDSEVAADLDKVKAGKKPSPVLLVQGTPWRVADGYHRVGASYQPR
jgi:hypothetical protein